MQLKYMGVSAALPKIYSSVESVEYIFKGVGLLWLSQYWNWLTLISLLNITHSDLTNIVLLNK